MEFGIWNLEFGIWNLESGIGNIESIKRIGKDTDVFFFKQFRVKDDRSTMKVGTDAVLLAIAANVSGVKEILEVGTGCGVIALALAQRSEASIDALEIDQDSVDQARENIRNSPWSGRIQVIHQSVQDRIMSSTKKYDMVISNPPYFTRSLKSEKEKRNISRHDDRLSFEDLVNCSIQLMNDQGSLWVVMPVKESEDFIRIASSKGLFVHYQIRFIPREGKKPNRIVLQLKKGNPENLTTGSLLHRNVDGTFAVDFIEFMKDFYIDF